jgi:hypothetical protein
LQGLRRLSLPLVPVGDEEATLLAAMPNLAELGVEARGLSLDSKLLLRRRFGDGLTLWE